MLDIFRTGLLLVAGVMLIFVSNNNRLLTTKLDEAAERNIQLIGIASSCDTQVLQCQAYQARIALELKWISRHMQECGF